MASFRLNGHEHTDNSAKPQPEAIATKARSTRSHIILPSCRTLPFYYDMPLPQRDSNAANSPALRNEDPHVNSAKRSSPDDSSSFGEPVARRRNSTRSSSPSRMTSRGSPPRRSPTLVPSPSAGPGEPKPTEPERVETSSYSPTLAKEEIAKEKHKKKERERRERMGAVVKKMKEFLSGIRPECLKKAKNRPDTVTTETILEEFYILSVDLEKENADLRANNRSLVEENGLLEKELQSLVITSQDTKAENRRLRRSIWTGAMPTPPSSTHHSPSKGLQHHSDGSSMNAHAARGCG